MNYDHKSSIASIDDRKRDMQSDISINEKSSIIIDPP